MLLSTDKKADFFQPISSNKKIGFVGRLLTCQKKTTFNRIDYFFLSIKVLGGDSADIVKLAQYKSRHLKAFKESFST